MKNKLIYVNLDKIDINNVCDISINRDLINIQLLL